MGILEKPSSLGSCRDRRRGIDGEDRLVLTAGAGQGVITPQSGGASDADGRAASRTDPLQPQECEPLLHPPVGQEGPRGQGRQCPGYVRRDQEHDGCGDDSQQPGTESTDDPPTIRPGKDPRLNGYRIGSYPSIALKSLAARGHDVVLFHVLSPDEVDLPFERIATFAGMEGEGGERVLPLPRPL